MAKRSKEDREFEKLLLFFLNYRPDPGDIKTKEFEQRYDKEFAPLLKEMREHGKTQTR